MVVEIVPFLGCLFRLDRDRSFSQRGIPLVRLAAEEAIEVVEAHVARPLPVRSHRARLPGRYLVTLAEMRRAVAMQIQNLGERRSGVRPDRVVARRRGGELGNG